TPDYHACGVVGHFAARSEPGTNIRFGSEAAVTVRLAEGLLDPLKADSAEFGGSRPFCATSGLMQCSKRRAAATHYSITSSARASRVGGISSPRALAVVRLMTRSNLVGCSTGMSIGFAPRRILSTMSATRRNWSGRFGP